MTATTHGVPPTSISVLTPNGGEVFHAGETRTVSWTFAPANATGDVVVFFKKGAADPQTIDTVPIQQGSVQWSICDFVGNGSDFVIGLATFTEPQLIEYGDGTFTIEDSTSGPTLQLTSPGSTDVIVTGTLFPIQWISSGVSGNQEVAIWLMRGNDEPISIGTAPIGNGQFHWQACQGVNTRNDYSVFLQLVVPACTTVESMGNLFSIIKLDIDNDTVADCRDNCPGQANPGQEDCDNDGKGNACDATPGLATWYFDGDGDGRGAIAEALLACNAPNGFVAAAADCNDADPTVYPGAPELCDRKDNNCNGVVDEQCVGQTLTWYRDADGDDYGDPAQTTQGAAQPTGYVAASGDCRDDDASVHPGAAEVCDDVVDNDCDGMVDCNDPDCAGVAGCPGGCQPSLCGPCTANVALFSLLTLIAVRGRRNRW